MSPLRRLAGTGLAVTGVLLALVVVSCAGPAPGTSVPAAAGSTLSTAQHPSMQYPSPTPAASATRITGTGTAIGPTTTPVPKGCPSGVVAITHLAGWTQPSKACVKAGARLSITLATDPGWGWEPMRVTPPGAATVVSTSASRAVRDLAAPTGTTSFCLATDASSSLPGPPDFPWQLCVTVRR
jgi:hypothetical protein